MKDITELKLEKMGFKKEVVTPEESGDIKEFHYFSYELANGECLLSQSNDERDGEFYSVEFLHMPELGKFWSYKDVKKLIKILKRASNE